MNNMKNNRDKGLVVIFLMLSFFLIGAQWTAAEAVDVTITGPGFSTTPYQLDISGLNINSADGSISLSVLSSAYTGEIHGTVTAGQGSSVYLHPASVANGAARYAAIDPQTGVYSFTNLPYDDYVVFPVLDGSKFTPSYRKITLNATTAVVNGADFAGGPAVSATYSIYGAISGASGSVTLNLSGAATQQISTTGSYIFSGLAPGSYTVTASAAGLNVSPQSSQVTITSSNMQRDFTASAMTYKISGYVKDSNNAAIAGATINSSAGTCSNTDATGYYICSNLTNGTYTVSASKSGYAITPAPASVNISNADNTQNFTASISTVPTYTISGTVTGLAAGTNATINLTGAATMSTVTSSGTYSFAGLLAGTYTVTPSASGYTFSPSSSGSFSLSSNTAKNFTATASGGGTPTLPTGVKTLNNMQEYLRNSLPVGGTDLYVANVLTPGSASFQNATKDWTTERDMIVMFGGAACDQPVPTVNDYNVIKTGMKNRTLPSKSETGVTVNNRTFYYNYQDLMNQGVLLGRLTVPATPAGCYYVLITNVATSSSDYSMYFSTVPR